MSSSFEEVLKFYAKYMKLLFPSPDKHRPDSGILYHVYKQMIIIETTECAILTEQNPRVDPKPEPLRAELEGVLVWDLRGGSDQSE